MNTFPAFEHFNARKKNLEAGLEKWLKTPDVKIPRPMLKHLSRVYEEVEALLETYHEDSFAERLRKLERVFFKAQQHFELDEEYKDLLREQLKEVV